MKHIGIVGLALMLTMQVRALSATLDKKPAVPPSSVRNENRYLTTRAYNSRIFDRVDELVRKHFYSPNIVVKEWVPAVKEYRGKVLGSRNLDELSSNINLVIKRLHTSHCEFVTANEEIYYFLHSLFKTFCSIKAPPIDYTGAIVGGVNCGSHQVRYVLDGSPAATAGILPGDEIRKVNGKPFRGQADFWGTSGRAVAVEITREGKTARIVLHPVLRDNYEAYVEAIGKSVKFIQTPQGTIGYVHDWSGGTPAHEKLEEILSGKINSTAGLIFDLRDGYGGNFFNDLDYFYRSPKAYPTLASIGRNGKINRTPLTYDKPVVTLINGGSRSGKELLAYSLKQTGRSRLVGENTAGAVVAGRLFHLDDRCALYLAVQGFDPSGVVLEGKGVAPDVEVPGAEPGGRRRQLEAAQRALLEELEPAQAPAANASERKLEQPGQ